MIASRKSRPLSSAPEHPPDYDPGSDVVLPRRSMVILAALAGAASVAAARRGATQPRPGADDGRLARPATPGAVGRGLSEARPKGCTSTLDPLEFTTGTLRVVPSAAGPLVSHRYLSDGSPGRGRRFYVARQTLGVGGSNEALTESPADVRVFPGQDRDIEIVWTGNETPQNLTWPPHRRRSR